MGESGRYLYAILRGLPAGATLPVRGMSGAPVESVRHGDLTALVSTVDLDEFGEDGLRRNLERLDWLEEAARTHDAVIHEASRHGPVAPLRLATVFLDDDGVRRRVVDLHDALTTVLDRVEGCREWSVKVMLPPERAPEPVAVASPAASMGGAEYLRRKRSAGDERARRESEAHVAAERVHDAVAAVARASRRLPPQDPRLTGHTGTMVHNGAYLVAEHDEPAFLDAVERVRGLSGTTLDCAGPWPPYSFAMLDAP